MPIRLKRQKSVDHLRNFSANVPCSSPLGRSLPPWGRVWLPLLSVLLLRAFTLQCTGPLACHQQLFLAHFFKSSKCLDFVTEHTQTGREGIRDRKNRQIKTTGISAYKNEANQQCERQITGLIRVKDNKQVKETVS